MRVLGRTARGAAPSGAATVAERRSMPLGELLVPFMKLSNNMHAEILTKSIGREVSGAGTWSAGLAAITSFAQANRMPTLRMRDGSGLSRVDGLTPGGVTGMLLALRSQPWFDTWYGSLPVAGEADRMVGGTLRSRMRGTPAAGNVRAKTGSLTGVTSLSGYVTGADGEPLVFSIMINQYLSASPKDVEDKIAIRLARFSRTSPAEIPAVPAPGRHRTFQSSNAPGQSPRGADRRRLNDHTGLPGYLMNSLNFVTRRIYPHQNAGSIQRLTLWRNRYAQTARSTCVRRESGGTEHPGRRGPRRGGPQDVCRVQVSAPVVNTAGKIQVIGTRAGCDDAAVLRIRIKQAKRGPDRTVKSGARRGTTCSSPSPHGAAPPPHLLRPRDGLPGPHGRLQAARLTCAPTGTPSPAPTPTPTVKPTATPTVKPTTPAPSPTGGTGGTVGTTEENEVVRLTNIERQKGGCGPLKHDPQLNKAAHDHSATQASRNQMTHQFPGGPTFVERIRAAGFTGGSAFAENVAAGYGTPASVVAGWMNSSGHRANIMNCKYNLIGAGMVKSSKGTPYWTQVFVAR
nr:hypothetical protein GCM10020093_056190 [Planobispora longispora]